MAVLPELRKLSQWHCYFAERIVLFTVINLAGTILRKSFYSLIY